jgi:glycosyltransferase
MLLVIARRSMVEGGHGMKISIITPTWNRATQLERMLASVEALVPHPHEHIIVDNLSTDATAAVVAGYSSRTPYPVIHKCEADDGIYDAMNHGAKLATGDLLYFLNDDDRLTGAGSLSVLASALTRCRADFAFGDVIVVDRTRGTARRRFHRQVNRLTLAEKSICQQATLYTRKALDVVGRFDPTLRAAADYDWVLRAFFQHSLRGAYLRFPVAEFALGGISSSPDHREAFEAEMQAVRHRYFDAADLDRARRYRRFWRKLPWGLQLTPGGGTGPAVRLASRIPLGSVIVPNPLAWIGF